MAAEPAVEEPAVEEPIVEEPVVEPMTNSPLDSPADPSLPSNGDAELLSIDDMDRDALRALLRDHEVPHSNNAGLDRLREQAKELTGAPDR